MATNGARAKAIIEGLANGTVANARLQRIVKNAIAYTPPEECPEPSDNALAGVFVQRIKDVVRGNLNAVGRARETNVHKAAVDAAGAAMEGDL